MPNDAMPLAAGGYTVADLSRRWRIGGDKIRTFLRRGELIAVNVAASLSAKPQWRITPESVTAFERGRSSAPAPRAPRKKRTTTVDYYPD